MKKIIFIGCILIFACQKNDVNNDIVNIPSNEVGIELSHAPSTDTCVKNGNTIIRINFDYDDYIGSYILSEFGNYPIKSIQTRGELIDFYKARQPSFEPAYSSFIDVNNYVFAKCEYLLAQECFNNDCSSQTRKAVLQIVIDKQKRKYEEFNYSFAARRTGIFLIAVILVKENDTSFTSALANNDDLRNALSLNQNISIDIELSNLMIKFAENYLSK
jgi:hypothetical protein